MIHGSKHPKSAVKHLRTVVCLTALGIAGCRSLPPAKEAASPPLRQATLHYDGLYDAPEADGSTHQYLRFYPDGTVVDVTVGATLRNLPRWLRRDHGYGQGRYQLTGFALSFSTTEPLVEGVREYEGRVSGRTLYMHWKNAQQRLSGDSVYHFVRLVDINAPNGRTIPGEAATGR